MRVERIMFFTRINRIKEPRNNTKSKYFNPSGSTLNGLANIFMMKREAYLNNLQNSRWPRKKIEDILHTTHEHNCLLKGHMLIKYFIRINNKDIVMFHNCYLNPIN